jgi:hypothetical protein
MSGWQTPGQVAQCDAVDPLGQRCALVRGHVGDHAAGVLAPPTPPGSASEAATGPKNKSSGCGCLALIVIALIVIAIVMSGNKGGPVGSSPGGSSGGSSSDAWSRDTAVSLMQGQGFSGRESPLADGTPRWLASDGSSNMFEAIGKDQLSSVSLTTIASTGNGELLGRFMNTWCQPGRSWVATTIGSYAGVDLDESKSFSGCSAHLQTITASDGAIVVVSIDR